MDRRNFIAALAGNLLVLPLAGYAQQAGKMRRIGHLSLESPNTQEFESLKAIGWVEGRNLLIARRHAGDKADLLKPMAEELLRLQVELIIANGTVASLVAKGVTTRIPIIAYRSGDPVGAGLVKSLARPGGNITAISTTSTVLDLKRLELLNEILPNARGFAELVNRDNPIYRVGLREKRTAFVAMGKEALFVEVGAASELEGAIAEAARKGAKALIVGADPLFGTHFREIAGAARKFQLPIIVDSPWALDGGALLSYGPSDAEIERKLAVYVDKILKGAKPADLPVEQPGEFELAVNLKVAKGLGITIPQRLLLRADRVIQ